MFSKNEKKYLQGRMFSQDHKYVLKHRIGKKLLEFEKELDLIIDSKEYFKDWLKNVLGNFIERLEK